jgi:hypothetical protein
MVRLLPLGRSLLTFFLLGSCASGPKAKPPSPEDEFDRRYEALVVRFGEAQFLDLQGQPHQPFDAVRSELEALFASVPEAGDSPSRRLQVRRDCALGVKLEAVPAIGALRDALEHEENATGPQIDGKPISRDKLLHAYTLSPDEDRRKAAFAASVTELHGKFVDKVRTLIEARRARAKQVTGGSFSDQVLRLRGTPPAELDRWLSDLEARTRAPYTQLLAARARARGVKTVHRWDLAYLLNTPEDEALDARLPKEPWPIVRAYFAAIGLSLDPPGVRAYFKEIPYGGQTIAVRVPSDVRITVNPASGARLFSTLLHESGHAVQAAHTAADLAAILKGYEWLLGASSSSFDEGMGQLFAHDFLDRSWLIRWAGLDDTTAGQIVRSQQVKLLSSIRSLLYAVTLERRIYQEGTARAEAIECELAPQLLGVDASDCQHGWASTIFLVSYPLYVQSYLVSNMVAAQVQAALRDRFGARRVDSPEVGAYLKHTLFLDGETRPWTERVADATGAPLSAEPLLHLLGL